MDEILIATPQGRIFGRLAGDPDWPLVLGIHGWSQRNGWHTWQPLLKPLGDAGYFALSVDMPGWGQSDPWGTGPLGGKQAVEATLSILEQLGKTRGVLMGKSWGGGIALQTALDHPDTIAKLILTAPAYSNLSRLANLSQEALVAWAENDTVIPVSFAERFAAALPECQLVIYPSGGHSAAPKNAKDFAPRAISFLQGGDAHDR